MTTELSNTMVTELRRSSPVTRKDPVQSNPQVAKTDRSGQGQQDAVQKVDSRKLEETVREMNAKFQSVHRNLQFSVDEASGHTVIKVIDAETDEVIRQIPSEEIMNLAHRLMDLNEEQGVIFRGTV